MLLFFALLFVQGPQVDSQPQAYLQELMSKRESVRSISGEFVIECDRPALGSPPSTPEGQLQNGSTGKESRKVTTNHHIAINFDSSDSAEAVVGEVFNEDLRKWLANNQVFHRVDGRVYVRHNESAALDVMSLSPYVEIAGEGTPYSPMRRAQLLAYFTIVAGVFPIGGSFEADLKRDYDNIEFSVSAEGINAKGAGGEVSLGSFDSLGRATSYVWTSKDNGGVECVIAYAGASKLPCALSGRIFSDQSERATTQKFSCEVASVLVNARVETALAVEKGDLIVAEGKRYVSPYDGPMDATKFMIKPDKQHLIWVAVSLAFFGMLLVTLVRRSSAKSSSKEKGETNEASVFD